MKKSKVLILHESENTKIALEELGLHLLQDYSFDFLNIIDYLRVDSKQYDFIIVDSYNDYIFEYFKNKTNRIIVTVNIMKEERPSDYIKRGAENFILKPYSIKEIRLILDKLKETLSIKEEAEENKLKFYTLLDNIPYMAWFKNKNSEYMIVNNEFKEHCGKDFETIRGRDDQFVWDGMIGENCRQYDLKVMTERKQLIFDEIIPGKKGYKQFNIYKVPVVDGRDNILGTMGIARDITDLKNKDVKFDILLENMPFAVFTKNRKGEIIQSNSTFYKLTNINEMSHLILREEDFLGKKYCESIAIEDKDVIYNKNNINLVRSLRTSLGERILEVFKSPIIDISGEVIGIICTMRDVTEVKSQEARIKRMAYTDSLTGLANRRGLYNYVETNLTSKDADATIMFMDLDNFKYLNDNYGHQHGDEILIEFGEDLQRICECGFVSRIGGDEFVIVWEGKMGRETATEIAEKILNLLNGKKMKFSKLSASIGIVTGNTGEETIDNFLTKGDLALYKAKDQGKNQYVFYNRDLDKKRCLNEEIEQDLRNALDREELELYYQPQYTCSNELIGLEALLRWNNDKYRKVPIIEIINIMEKSVLIDEIGKFITRSAFSFAKKINENREDKIIVSVNISAIQIMKHNFVRSMKKIISEIDVDPSCVGIEITETVLLQNINENILKIKELKDIGVKISLDDFGTGYSSFSYLVKIPLTNIKIDKSFIWGMKDSEEYRTLVKLCIDTAHALNLKVVAEGVETTEDLCLLKYMKADYIQGYLFSRPLPKKEIEEMIL
ncbi:sensor domain-containing protein [Candidatus Cetobacterium colombiensis]|uniref:EAL domain-containing protein n=1 Tax=Candidatus Cetobacterium colombiensis TaxID=3073100 RepID=A0ABU4W7G4_9FUSO|nr:EAL domain-containing protein [Candidatus Cetobacterium colombiensis]MDX8334987.1 EAL domain-containing protein [Candidatus Cetobacterium colombiensis]